jgi:acetyl-CoA synthetase
MEDYNALYNRFKWNIPIHFNIGVATCDVHAENSPDSIALICEDDNGKTVKYSFHKIKNLSNKFANVLKSFGAKKGDRFAIFLSQQIETLIAHLAGYKLGLINVPLFTLFGQEALEYRINNSGAKFIIANDSDIDKLIEIKKNLPGLQKIIVVGKCKENDIIKNFHINLEKASDKFSPLNTNADDPCLIIYTSGTTGPPKGALHAHRMLLGHLPGIELPHDFFPQKGDLFWTPADWAWIGGLYDVLFPSLYYKIPVVACRMRKFDPEKAFFLMEKHGIRNVFMPPTALKILRNIKNIKKKYNLKLRTIASGGESLGEEILSWGMEELGIAINEFYGQTEANLLVTNSSKVIKVKPGSMGRAVMGHEVSVIDKNGNKLPPGEEGEIAVKYPDPVMFLEYWRNPEATKEKFIGDWMTTGDMAKLDEHGYFWFSGRKDDVISSAGYRIGPSEIEDCLLKHPAVSLSAVIGKPDKLRGEIVKAFIVLKQSYKPNEDLLNELKNFVKQRLAAHEYPREIEFVDSLPMTVTGKIMRKDLRKREIEKMKKGGDYISF